MSPRPVSITRRPATAADAPFLLDRVPKANPAKALYERMGFVVTGASGPEYDHVMQVLAERLRRMDRLFVERRTPI